MHIVVPQSVNINMLYRYFLVYAAPLSGITTMTVVTQDEPSQNQDVGTVVAVAVLGTILGLVLIAGTAVITVFILYRCRDDAHKAIISALRG